MCLHELKNFIDNNLIGKLTTILLSIDEYFVYKYNCGEKVIIRRTEIDNFCTPVLIIYHDNGKFEITNSNNINFLK